MNTVTNPTLMVSVSKAALAALQKRANRLPYPNAGSPVLTANADKPASDPAAIPMEESEVSLWTPDMPCQISTRQMSPELALGDVGSDPVKWVSDRPRMLPSLVSDMSGASSLSMVVMDYQFAGTVGQQRAAAETLYAVGNYDDTRVVGVGTSPNFVATFVGGTGPCIAARVDFGISALSFQPFDLNIVTSGFLTGVAVSPNPTGVGGVQRSADRNFTLRVRGNTVGGSIWFPFMQRFTPGSRSDNRSPTARSSRP